MAQKSAIATGFEQLLFAAGNLSEAAQGIRHKLQCQAIPAQQFPVETSQLMTVNSVMGNRKNNNLQGIRLDI